MTEILTADELGNDNFYHEAPRTVRGDKHRQQIVFDKGDFAFGLPKGNATVNPQAKQAKHDRLERLTDEFLGSGGAITICPPGKPPNFKFGRFKVPSAGRSSRPSSLTRPQWREPILTFEEERDFIRGAKAGDERAKCKLFESFHRLILKTAAEYSGPSPDDLTAVASMGFWEAVLHFDLGRNSGRLSTYAAFWIRKRLSDAVYDWCKDGTKGSRAYRSLVSNPNATAEELVVPGYITPKDAEEAVERAELTGNPEQYDTTESRSDDDDRPREHVPPRWEVVRLYDCFGKYPLSPAFRYYERATRWIDADKLVERRDRKERRRLNQIGRRQYALELVEQDRIRIAYRAKPSRYLCRKGSALKDYTDRARQTNLPTAADTWASLCREKNDRAQKLKEAAAGHKTIQKPDPYKELRPPKPKPGRSSFRAPAVCFVWRDNGTELGKKNAKLMAARLSKPKPRGERIIWHDTRTTIPGKSLPLPCQPTLQVRHGLFVKKNFSVSATFAELHCSAI
jgi:hypothetical protein